MPKAKTHSGAKKRFKLKKSGLIKRNKMNRRHILTKKSPDRKRHLRKARLVHDSDMKRLQSCIQG